MENEQEMFAKVKGRVQGVGFRALVYKYATALKLKGLVKNCEDGSVEIFAQGPKEKLEALIKELHMRPGYGTINSIEVNFHPINETFENFNID